MGCNATRFRPASTGAHTHRPNRHVHRPGPGIPYPGPVAVAGFLADGQVHAVSQDAHRDQDRGRATGALNTKAGLSVLCC